MTMYQSNVLKVCDYITLNLQDADFTSGEGNNRTSLYRWDIPQSAYMSNQRSQVCTVELSHGCIDVNTNVGGTDGTQVGIVGIPVTLQYVNGGYNQYASKNGKPVIAGSFNGDTLKSTGALLCQARPRMIEIRILRTNREEFLTAHNLRASFTLKYSYYDAVGTGRDMQHEKTISL